MPPILVNLQLHINAMQSRTVCQSQRIGEQNLLVANLHRHPANICIEVGRQNTPHSARPSFSDLEQALRSIKTEAA